MRAMREDDVRERERWERGYFEMWHGDFWCVYGVCCRGWGDGRWGVVWSWKKFEILVINVGSRKKTVGECGKPVVCGGFRTNFFFFYALYVFIRFIHFFFNLSVKT